MKSFEDSGIWSVIPTHPQSAVWTDVCILITRCMTTDSTLCFLFETWHLFAITPPFGLNVFKSNHSLWLLSLLLDFLSLSKFQFLRLVKTLDHTVILQKFIYGGSNSQFLLCIGGGICSLLLFMRIFGEISFVFACRKSFTSYSEIRRTFFK